MAFAASCPLPSLAAGKAPAAVKWRLATTNPKGKMLPTTKPREDEIRTYRDNMQNTIFGTATPVMDFVVSGTHTLDQIQTADYHAGRQAIYEVKGLKGKTATLKGTLLLPVSGHTSVSDAQIWAKQDTYNVWVEVNGKRTSIAQNAKSLDFVTLHEVALPMVKGQDTNIYYERSGSGGVGGFVAGRMITFRWR